jgi:hypothetical protein
MQLAIRSVLLIFLGAYTSFAATYFGPTPYLSSADSPFTGIGFSNLYLENFESGALTVPGATLSAGWTVVAPSGFTDSVDSDDGATDGTGAGGRSLYSNNTQSALRVTFNAIVLGVLPTHAGIVWTDAGNVSAGTLGAGPVSFEAFDAANVSLGVIGPFTLGNGSALSQTGEDRFFGIQHDGGISAIEIRMSNSLDWEVDHLQFGIQAIPEPGTYSLLVLGFGLVLVMRRSLTRNKA